MASSEEYENCNWCPDYGMLPMEIVTHIFRYLSFKDLQAAGSTCSHWNAALDMHEFNDSLNVVFSKVCLSDQLPPASHYLKTVRKYRHFYFDEVSIGNISEVIKHIGRTAHSLTLDNVDLNDKQFYAIMHSLPNLRKLCIQRCSPLFMSGTILDEQQIKDLAKNFESIKELSLCNCQYLSDAIFVRLTSLMPNLEVLNLSRCPIAFHNAIHRRFYPNSSPDTPSESVLTFQYVLRVLMEHKMKLHDLDFSQTLLGLSLVAFNDLKLKRLNVSACKQLVYPSIKSFIKSQPLLTVLDLSMTICLNNEGIFAIVKSLPALEYLNLSGCLAISNEAAESLKYLPRLNSLNLSACDRITSEGIMRGIASIENRTLKDLNISCLQICEECIKCVAINLPELRTLNVGFCINGVTDDAVQCIIQNLRWLRYLSLEMCVHITDAALTGINISRLALARSSIATPRSSMENFYPAVNASVAKRQNTLQSMKISLRSKAEEEIVRDAKRKEAMFAVYETKLINENDFEGYNIQALRGLRSLNLSGCNKISDVSLKYGLKLIELQQLQLANCQQISLLGIEALVRNCPSIEVLILSDCYNINDKALQIITSKLQRLSELDISGCSQLTDHSMDAIILNCKNLKTLSLFRCRSMYTDISERVVDLPLLRNLNMENVTCIDHAELFRFKKRLDY